MNFNVKDHSYPLNMAFFLIDSQIFSKYCKIIFYRVAKMDNSLRGRILKSSAIARILVFSRYVNLLITQWSKTNQNGALFYRDYSKYTHKICRFADIVSLVLNNNSYIHVYSTQYIPLLCRGNNNSPIVLTHILEIIDNDMN